ncbi:hypothetical protein PENTCL1PPCAC_9272 [Pristionchus entomophagus]|uniref:Uncharacterized protein n=1 Tax=Pristionchus entomophagus TaxID=358040 RepID=A0AAV5SWG2_9BILA|nr:hypothetical protein PENTCL1PPCAC_9272 [Pristionchus entomophagus]
MNSSLFSSSDPHSTTRCRCSLNPPHCPRAHAHYLRRPLQFPHHLVVFRDRPSQHLICTLIPSQSFGFFSPSCRR